MRALRSGLAVTAALALSATALLVAPLTATADPTDPTVVVNEINYDTSSTGLADSIELYNVGPGSADLSGWKVADDKADSFGVIPDGTSLAEGGYLVLVKDIGFPFGLGKGDTVTLLDDVGTEVDEYVYANTAPISVWARCPDGTGDWAHATAVTLGSANDCSAPATPGSIAINEVDSQPSDWVEFINQGGEDLDISGYEIRDNSDDHRWRFASGTSIASGGYLVVEASTVGLIADGSGGWISGTFGAPIGIGSVDEIRLYDTTGTLIDRSGTWSAHAAIDGDFAAATLARCPEGVGAFKLARITKGAANDCVRPDVEVNEINSNGGPNDWAEIVNTGTTALDISGWTLIDNDPSGHAADVVPVVSGTTLAPGGFFVFTETEEFDFGLGNGDTVTIRDADGFTVAEYAYPAHAEGFWARCPDGSGDFVDVAIGTPGEANACGVPVRINEVESSGGTPGDWIELVNPTDSTIDVSGVVVKDADDTHSYTIPTDSTIAPGDYLVLEEADFGFGLGGGDSVRLFDGEFLVDSTTWPAGHPDPSWGRCPDTTGAFSATVEVTKGAANVCAGEIESLPWPGSADVTVLDPTPTFLEDSSGLDFQHTDSGDFLWAIDNGTGRFWKLAVGTGGAVAFADGWEAGKRIRFQADAADAAAAGPDTEGITVDGEGFIYAASERDNSAKDVNQDVVLKVNPDAAGPDLVAVTEWDLTAKLPTVDANLGIEAVEWVPDSALAGKLYDDTQSAVYDPAGYPLHGTGLFFVAVEDGGPVFAFALNSDGSSQLVSSLAPGLGGVMGLDYDSVLGGLWAVCDDGCEGALALLTFTGGPEPEIVYYDRPAGMPNLNNEGFTTAGASAASGGTRPVWWFADGAASASLRVGTLPAAADPTEPTEPGGGSTPPLTGDELVPGNKGTVSGPVTGQQGQTVTVFVGVPYAGDTVDVWLYSTPMSLGSAVVSSAGTVTVTLPLNAPAGTHRIAVYAADGTLIGWSFVELTTLAATGGADQTPLLAGGALLFGIGLLLLVGLRVRRATR